MIRSPLGLRINPDPARPVRDQLRQAARLGAKGVVLDATGDLAPDRLSETGRRELRHLLRSVELAPIALNLPTRRPFDTEDQLDDRLNRAARAFGLAFELGARLVLARVGAVPPGSDATRREVFSRSVNELGRRAEHLGVRLAVETGSEPGADLRSILDGLGNPGLAASLDPAALLRNGHDPIASTRDLATWVAHAYANDATATGQANRVALLRNPGFPPGALDWEEYLGALEEIGYSGYLSIWPDPSQDVDQAFAAMVARLNQY